MERSALTFKVKYKVKFQIYHILSLSAQQILIH